MGGSPRVEKAAQIRIDNPNLTTEEAMKLAGYNEEQAADPKRQSNVRQKTHRLVKGRKRSADDLDLYTPDPKRMSYPTSQDPVYPRMALHLPEQSTNIMSDYARRPHDMHYPQQQQQQQQRLSMDNFSTSQQQYPLHQPALYPGLDVRPNHSVQQNLIKHPHTPLQQPNMLLHQSQATYQQYLVPFDTPTKNPGSAKVDSAKLPGGSPRIEDAAKIRLEDPTVSTEEAMKLAGFTDEEAKDKKKQNNVRQKTHRMSQKQAKINKKPEQQHVSIQFQEQIAKLENKLETFVEKLEKYIEEKIQQIGDRIDQKFATVTELLERIASHRSHQDSSLPPRDPVAHKNISDTIQM